MSLLTCCRQYSAVELKTLFEAAWAITNLAAGPPESVASVLMAAPLLAVLLRSTSTHIAEQSAWALGKPTTTPSAKNQLLLSIKQSDALLNLGNRWETVLCGFLLRSSAQQLCMST